MAFSDHLPHIATAESVVMMTSDHLSGELMCHCGTDGY